MSNICESQQPHPYSQACEHVRSIIARSARRRQEHGRQVEQVSEVYFRLIAQRVKPGPELSMAFALTSALARIHHLRGGGADRDARNEFYGRLQRGISHNVPNFREEFGVTHEEFIALLRSDFSQYAGISSEAYDLNPELKLHHYAQLIQDGGLSLRTLILKLSDLCLKEEDWLEGAPLRGELGECERRILSKKMKNVFFPFADGIGWLGAANRIRENSLLWDPELRFKLEEVKARMGPLRHFYREAGLELEGMIKTVLQMMASNATLQEYRDTILGAEVQPSRVKSEPAIVFKEEDGREISDLVAARVVFNGTPEAAAFLGLGFSDVVRDSGLITRRNVNNYYNYPKSSGYQAIHTTGVRQFRGRDVPIEVQFQDEGSYKDACCGRSGRIGYKGREGLDDLAFIDALNEVLRPVLDAVTDVRGAIDPHPAPLAEESNGKAQATFTVHIEGSPLVRPIILDRGASVVDVLVKVLDGPHDALAYPGNFIGPHKLSFFDMCPPEIYLKRTGAVFSRKQVIDILSRNNVLQDTKVVVRALLNGEKAR